ncbi:MAG: SRPBCC domain-containing protein [Oligoflexales bacterium]
MCKTIKQKVKFRLSPERVYQLLTDSKLHTALTGQKAVINRHIGGKFSTCAGHVTGINVDLVPGKRVVQAWRTKDFPVGIFSMATFLLSPTRDGGTDLTLIHRGVPKELIPEIETDWRQSYWGKIRALVK